MLSSQNKAVCVAHFLDTPIGLLKISATTSSIVAIDFFDQISDLDYPQEVGINDPIRVCEDQLKAYFAGERKYFDMPLMLIGTEFQKKVWKKLLEIPFGKTVSYLSIAIAVGNKNAVRAVGAANGQNPIPIIIPCHRVIGSNGDLTGYGGGIRRKKWLLGHEGVALQQTLSF